MHLYTNYDESAATNIEGFTFNKFTYDVAGSGARDYSATDRLDTTFISQYASGDTVNMYSQWTANNYNINIAGWTPAGGTTTFGYNDLVTIAANTIAPTAPGQVLTGLSESTTAPYNIDYNVVGGELKLTRASFDGTAVTLTPVFENEHYEITYTNNDGSALNVDQ